MRWQRGTSDADIEDRRGSGGGGGMRLGGGGGMKLGLGGLILLGILSLVFKQNFFALLERGPLGQRPLEFGAREPAGDDHGRGDRALRVREVRHQ